MSVELLGGRYARERVIGRGGMGSVWVGTDEVLQRSVALKELAPDAASAAEREARLAATVNHPHVVPVFDLLIDEGRPWLVMEYVEGPTLAQYVAAEGPMTPDEAAVLLRQIADALHAAHAAGVVHRDVKPSNVLLAAADRALLTDFGVARTQDATLTSGVLTASPAYLAPEIAAGKGATPASDVWSLGATLFHMLEGRAPYEVADGNVLGVLYRIVEEEPPQSTRAGWLAPLLRGTMTKDPQQRWSLDRVQTFLGGRDATIPIGTIGGVAGVGGIGDTAERPAIVVPLPRDRRRTAIIAGAALLAVAVIIGLALLLAQGGSSPQATTGGSQGSPATTPSTSQSSSPSVSPSPTAGGITSFVQNYLSTAPQNPTAAFGMLTPSYQRTSGGLAGYRGFWGSVTGIHSVSAITPSLAPLGATYTYTYSLRGQGTRTEQVHLSLVFQNGTYLIDGASSIALARAEHGNGSGDGNANGNGND